MALINLDEREGIALATLDRPPANAMTPDLIAAGLATIAELNSCEPDAVVLTGEGDFFCAGADLRAVPELSMDEQAALARDINRFFEGWYRLRRPLVCAVNGHAVAGGLITALCGDHRVVGRSGRFGLTEIKVGIPYPSMAMAVVQAELSPPVARRLTMRGELYSAEEAMALDLFDEQTDDATVLDRAVLVAQELGALPRLTFELVKQRRRAVAQPARGEFAAADIEQLAAEARSAGRAVLDDEGG